MVAVLSISSSRSSMWGQTFLSVFIFSLKRRGPSLSKKALGGFYRCEADLLPPLWSLLSMGESPDRSGTRRSSPSQLDLWGVLCLRKLTLDVVFLDIYRQLQGSLPAPSRFRRVTVPRKAGSHSFTVPKLAKCQAWIGIQGLPSSDVFLSPRKGTSWEVNM